MRFNILITSAGRRNYLINYFKVALKDRGMIIVADSNKFATAFSDADVSICVSSFNQLEYIEDIAEIIKKYSVKVIISLNDYELLVLSKNKKYLESLGTKVIVPTEEIVSIVFDKWKCHNFINRIGLNSPKSYLKLEDALNDIDNNILNFPVVIKPTIGSGSEGVELAETVEELKLFYKIKCIQIKKANSINDSTALSFKNNVLIQEKVEGKEFGLDIVNNFNSKFFACFAREKLSMRNGETDMAISVIDKSLIDVGKQISKNLMHLGLADVDVIVQDKKIFILDINLRFGGGYPFSHLAGANITAVYVDWIIDNYDLDTKKHINYKSGIIHSKYDKLTRIFV